MDFLLFGELRINLFDSLKPKSDDSLLLCFHSFILLRKHSLLSFLDFFMFYGLLAFSFA